MAGSLKADFPRRVYDPTDIEFTNRGPKLYFEVNGHAVALPVVNASKRPEDPPVWLCWFDPSRNPERTVGAAALQEILSLLQPQVVVMPASSKSEGMIADAVTQTAWKLGQDMPLYTFLGGTDIGQVNQALAAEQVPTPDLGKWQQEYDTITGHHKCLALLPSQVAEIANALQ